MAKPMTSEQIETELQLITDRVRDRWEDRAQLSVAPGVRAAFTLGQDHGQALMLERAQSLIAPRFVDEKTSALGAAVLAILAWVSLVKGRSWAPQSSGCILFAGEEGPIDLESSGTGGVRFCYGADASESIAVAATWCTEHMKNNAPKVPDTMPTPPDETNLVELADNRAATDAAMKQREDLGGF